MRRHPLGNPASTSRRRLESFPVYLPVLEWYQNGMAQGSTGNVIAALASFFVAGLGQLLQGRVLTALVHAVLAGIVWVLSAGTLGWIVHIWSTISAARWKGPSA